MAGGLNDSALEDGLPLPEFVTFQNYRIGKGRRGGVVRQDVSPTTGHVAQSLNGSTQYVSYPVDTRVWGYDGTRWTLELLIDMGSVSGTQPILEAGTTTPSISVDVSSGFYRVRIWDSSATLTTLLSTSAASTDPVSLQVVRDGAGLTLRVDNVAEDTDTMSATNGLRTPVGDLRVGNDGSSFGNVTVDYFRLLGVARADHADRLVRFPDPRAAYVLADYGDDLTVDRSRYENNGTTTGSPPTTTALSHQASPVFAIAPYLTQDGEAKILIQAGPDLYLADGA